MNVAPGHAGAVSGLTVALDQPEFAAAIGLVKFGSLKNRRRAERPFFKGFIGRLLQRS
jgi:hypothetical protein